MRAGEEQLYLEYLAGRERWLSRIAYRLCGDRQQAEDLVQQVLVDLYVHWSTAARASTVDGYVQRMVVHANPAVNSVLSRRSAADRPMSSRNSFQLQPDVLPQPSQT